jgi:hypothetical protein
MRAQVAMGVAAALGAPALGQPEESLGNFFGFLDQRIIVADEGCGPALSADVNGDGRPDVVLVNNRKSRIEIHALRAQPREEDERRRAQRRNELPPSAWYDREFISVAHRVGAILAHDLDGDGRVIYAGAQPEEIVVLRADESGRFGVHHRQRVRGLAARRGGFRIGDVTGDPRPELLALVADGIQVFPLGEDGTVGEGTPMGAATKVAGFFVADVNGDGQADLLAAVPDDAAPLRLYLQERDPRVEATVKVGLLATELRFEMPPIVDAEVAVFPGRAAASIGVIERASRRIVIYDVEEEGVEPLGSASAHREVQAEVTAWTGGASKDRAARLVDIDQDGMMDLIATDPAGNAVVVRRQERGVGLGAAAAYASLRQPADLDAGRWLRPAPHVFVLSQEEKTVGVCWYDTAERDLSFPVPITLATSGATPLALRHVLIGGEPALAVVVRRDRDYILELHEPRDGTDASLTKAETFMLRDVKRAPGAIIAADADQDGHQDVLLLTPGEPMVMLRAADGDGGVRPREILTRDRMAQFGLVQSAGPANTAILDFDGDGRDDLLIADANFVRGCAYDPERGWRVVEQVNVPDPSTKLVGVSLMPLGRETVIVAADAANARLLVFGRDASGRWGVRDRIRVLGFPVSSVSAGRYAGDGQPSILCLGDEGFAVVRLGGRRAALRQVADFRSDATNRFEHEIEFGDLNGDGFLDMVVLDATEQMCQVFTFSASRRMHLATEFEVFQSRLFTRGQARQFEPSQAIIADLTGDGANDLALVVHDRVLVYPQMTTSPP